MKANVTHLGILLLTGLDHTVILLIKINLLPWSQVAKNGPMSSI